MTKTRIATHIEVEWLDRASEPVTCPNCGAVGPVRQLLDIDYKPPDAEHRYILQICPNCTVRFVDNTETMDYSTDELIEIGWNIYQVQLGAGVWPISAPLTRIDKPAGARVLEIGGAYGFGLDFCIRARGWRGEGYDPSPLAAFGARELGLNIRQEYFEAKDIAAGPWDIVITTEVIEHLTHPPEFFALMRAALAPDGLLVLTTPDAEWITPELSAGAMMPLLSPGAHVVLQTASSLQAGLRAAGFAHVVVKREAMSLIAYASAAPFALLEDPAPARAMYRRYLVERAKLTEPMSDLRLGFAGRGLFEAANDGDPEAVEVAWAALVPAVKARFGIDLESLTPLPEGASQASLAELARMIPLGLGMILFGRAMHLISEGADRSGILPMLRLARAAIDALQGALGRRSLTDGLSASIRGIIGVEILLCQAEAADPACVAPLIALDDEVAAWRGFVALVNADALALAAELKTAALGDMPDAALGAGLRTDALLSLANFVLAPGGETAKAFDYALALRALGADADAIILAAFTRLVNASRYEEALAAAQKFDVNALASRLAEQKTGRDARLAQMVLDLAVGDPAEIPGRLEGLEIEPERRDVLVMEAFIRLVNGSRYDEALDFLRDHDIPALAALRGGEAARNTGLARMVLDLAVGDPADIPGRLKGLDLPDERREVLLLEAFVRLANGSRFAEAVAFAAEYDVPGMLRRQNGEVAGNAAIGLAVVDLAAGDPAAVRGRFDAVEVDPARREALILGAYTCLVNAARYAEAEALAAAEPCFTALETLPGEAADDARMASVMLDLQCGRTAAAVRRIGQLAEAGADPAVLGPLSVDGFVRLVNEGDYATAAELARHRGIERRLAACKPQLRQDALAALLILELQPGSEPSRIVQRLDEAMQGGLDETRVHELAMVSFVTLVNRGEPATARLLWPMVEKLLIKLRPPYDDSACNLMFAAGILFLQDRDENRRAAAVLARLRDGLVKRAPPGGPPDKLLWPAMRGEVLALHQLKRGAEATTLLREFTAMYEGAPEDLLQQIESAAG